MLKRFLLFALVLATLAAITACSGLSLQLPTQTDTVQVEP